MARYVAVIAPHLHDHLPLPAVAAQAGIPLRTAQRWLARYRGQDLAGLARPGRSDRGRRRIQPELVALIEGLALRRPPPRITTIHRRAGEVAAARGWAAPAYATVHAIVTSLDPGLVTLARDGIHFQGLRYLDPVLAAYVGEPVTIRYDPRDLAEIRVFHHGTLLCRAISPEHAGQAITLKDIQAARAARRRQLRGQINKLITTTTGLLTGTGTPGSPAASPPDPGPPPPARTGPRLYTYREDKP